MKEIEEKKEKEVRCACIICVGIRYLLAHLCLQANNADKNLHITQTSKKHDTTNTGNCEHSYQVGQESTRRK